jgi:polyhydroxyalkanoate synthesis regulator phasin
MEDTGSQPRTGEPPTRPGPAPEPSSAPRPPSLDERVDGLRAWVAQLERRLAIRSYAGGLAIVLALAAGIVAVVLALGVKDESATKTDVQALRDQVEAVQRRAVDAAKADVATLSDRIDALESRVGAVASDQRTADSEISVVQDDIDDLRSQISDLRTAAASSDRSSLQQGR